MSKLKFIGSLVTILLLAGCSRMHQQDKEYIYHSKSITPVVAPKGVAMKKGENYYPLPGTPNPHITPPSIIPPGSDLARFDKKHKNSASNRTQLAVLEKTNRANKFALHVAEPVSKAWDDVKTALGKTRYQILDEDPASETYYVLDIVSTNNKIAETTPIYSLHLQSQGKETEVYLRDAKGKPVSGDIAARILSAIEKNIT